MKDTPRPVAHMPCCGAVLDVLRWYQTVRYTVRARHLDTCPNYVKEDDVLRLGVEGA